MNGTTAVLTVAGVADLGTVPVLRERLQGLRPPDVDRVVVDATDLVGLDAGCLAELTSAAASLRAAGGDLVVAAAPDEIARAADGAGLRTAPSVPDGGA